MKLTFACFTGLLTIAAWAQQIPWTGPSASISWNNLDQIRVYGQDPDGYLMEWVYGSNIGWQAPQRIGPPFKAKYGTAMSAIVSFSNGYPRIRVYYYEDDGRYHEAVYENGWSRGALLP